MDVLLLVIRLGLAAVLVVAAAGKLAGPARSVEALARFGVTAAVAALLPVAELVIAAGLVVDVTAGAAGVAAALLLLAFCVGIARVLLRGEAPPCNCFGSVGAKPVSRVTLARNAGLLVAASFVAAAGWDGGGASATAWIAGADALPLVIAAAVLLQFAFSWQLLRQNGRLLERVAALEAGDAGELRRGDPGPAFVLPDVEGHHRSLVDLLDPVTGALLVFTSPDCGHCEPLLPLLGRPREEHEAPVVVVSRGAQDENAARAREHGVSTMLLQDRVEIANAYGVHGFPAAVLLDGDGHLAADIAHGATLVSQALDASATILPVVHVP